ncbi:cupin domain-containing protein [Desulfobulbus rhabdoformis]|uniref:cupin domain-containing protein n=1 Tax=Desulfobulbus rhabdoformis TaxID=34032 RepID=UPI0019640467|nr:cupin domain-containing protein [Desulfobulbus rhabdoformis]
MKVNNQEANNTTTEKREPTILHREDWASHDRLWKGYVQGADLGTDVTVLFFVTEQPGEGPRWHVHPYDEIFIVRKGNALFTIGDKKIKATAGDILLGPANIPHKYHNLGPGVLETTDIHLSDRWIQTNLEDPEQSIKLNK